MSGNSAATAKPGFKTRLAKEMKSYASISLYLAFLFCAMSTYSMLLLKRYDVSNGTLTYTFAIINALVVGKVILIGEMMHIGTRFEHRPLYQSALWKAFVFGLLLFVFHILEELVKRIYHGEPAGTALEKFNVEEALSRTIVIFLAFIPLFAFRELARVMGEGKLSSMMRGPSETGSPEVT